MLKQSVFILARVSGINACLRARSRDAFRVVTYHGVDEQDHPVVNFDRLQIQPALFKRQLAALVRTYRIVPLREALQDFLAGRGWPRRGLSITFDDGYRNNLEVAAPILQQMGLPATVFVTSGFLEGRVRPWWYDVREVVAETRATELLLPGEPPRDLRTVAARQQCCSALEWAWAGMTEQERAQRLKALCEAAQTTWPGLRYPFMTRDEVIRLSRMGFDVEAHGSTHASLRAESDDRVRREVQESVAFVQSLDGRRPCCLAWPYGHKPVSRTLAECVLAEAGLLAAVSVIPGFNDGGADLTALKRWDLHGGYSVAAVHARLSGFVSLLRPADAGE